MIAELLVSSRDYAVTVIDRSQAQLDRLETGAAVTKVAADITRRYAAEIARRQVCVLSAAPTTPRGSSPSPPSRRRALPRSDRGCREHPRGQAAREGARTAFIPNAAGAGFITIVASDLASHFDQLQDVRMRVGALPKFPSNALNYNLTWSTDGSSTSIASRAKPSSTVSFVRPRRSRSWRNSRSTAFSTRPSTPRAASAPSARHCGQGAQPELPHHPLSRHAPS